MPRGIITRNVDSYVSNKRIPKDTEVIVTDYKSPAYCAIKFEKCIYLVPRDAVKIIKENKK